MSRTAEQVQEEAEKIRRGRLEASGLADQYDSWRESLPNARIPDNEVYEMFMNSQLAEEAATSGRLSVSTGGTEITTDTDVPTPGPDAEETRPDEAGEVSKGADERDTDLKIVEGMWLPPEESEALNYESPSTYKMSRSRDWVDNAKVLYDFMKPKGETRGQTGGLGANISGIIGNAPKQFNDEEIGQWARNQLSGFQWNTVMTLNYAQKIMTSDDPKLALAFLNLINMYDHSDGSAMEFAGAVGEVLTDPTTYLGLGAGGAAAKAATKALIKTKLKKSIQVAIAGATAGTIEGGMLGGGYDLTVQNVEQEAGAREDIDLGRTGIATGIGMGAGAFLGGVGGAWAGRKMDKFAAEVERQRLISAGAGDVLDQRSTQELNEQELLAMLVDSVKAADSPVGEAATVTKGQRDETAQIAMQILGDDGQIPRLDDGSLDFGKIHQIVKDVTVKREADRIKEFGPDPKPQVDDLSNVIQAEDKFTPNVTDKESRKLIQKIIEMEELEKGDIIMRTTTRPGSRVVDELGTGYEVVGRTKNGWYKLRDDLGRESSFRRKDFEVTIKAPAPRKAGPMHLDPFSENAAKIIAMNERIVSGKLVGVKITTPEQMAIVKDLRDMGVNITKKQLASFWTPAEMVFLRNTYNSQALAMADLSRKFESKLRNDGVLTNQDLAFFNQAHSQFVSTRDLFFGVSGNAARQLQILRTKPTDEVYQFSQSLMDSISLQGGRANTERAIKLMSDFSRKTGDDISNVTRGISKMSDSIWGSAKASAILNVRYNMMLSSWRTHFFNFLGNSASGVYQHLMVSPVRMGINNLAYARDLARSVIQPKYKPDPADRLTRHQWYAELRGHYSGFRDSLALAKEIAMGRDIGEGKVWNELGLRYNVINVPDSAFGKAGTTPVRLLEAGDAFFKNQYYNSKMHEIASIRARADEVNGGKDYETRYNHHLDNPDSAAERAATAFAAKQTYTNDPNVYGGVLAALAKGVSTAQNQSLLVNLIVPFVRTPANLLSYSMEMIGGNAVLSPAKTYRDIMEGTALESQEALSRLTVAAGLWLAVAEMHENGDITGTGPTNWEEQKVWEAAGWQPNSIKIHGQWYDMSRAAPAGQSLATIASIYDYYSMTQQQDKPAMEWVGVGLLYTADMIIDESYLSTASDIMTAISSKKGSRARSVGASIINSMLVPNLLRDFRRPADEVMRSTSSNNLMVQVHKQMMNASPWHSEDLPPSRDWRGQPKNYYGNAYVRALIPFNVRDPDKSDPASMALAYSRIPVSTPNKTIDWPGGGGDGVDLFAMDGGDGYVYDKYLQLIGESREHTVNRVMQASAWRKLVDADMIGPNSVGDFMLRKALGVGSKLGRMAMLDFLISHHGENNTFERGNGETIVIQHSVSVDTYRRLRRAIGGEVDPLEPTMDQYIMNKPIEGPEFFKP